MDSFVTVVVVVMRWWLCSGVDLFLKSLFFYTLCYAGSTYGPVGPLPRAPRLGGPRTWKMLLNKKKQRSWERKKRKKEKGRKEGEKEKGKAKKIVFRTNKLTERLPCWSIDRFCGPIYIK